MFEIPANEDICCSLFSLFILHRYVGGTDFVGAAVGAAGKVATAAQNVAERTQDQVVVTTLNVAGRTRQAVVHFKNGINTGGPDDESVNDGEASDDGSTESVEKKNL